MKGKGAHKRQRGEAPVGHVPRFVQEGAQSLGLQVKNDALPFVREFCVVVVVVVDVRAPSISKKGSDNKRLRERICVKESQERER